MHPRGLQQTHRRCVVIKQPGTDLDSALHIDDPHVSYAFYGKLDQHRSEWFRFNGMRDSTVFVQLLVPETVDLQTISMRAMLIGPGLPDSAKTMVLPKGYGTTTVELNPESAGRYYEKFTQVGYHASPPLRIKLPADGAVGIVVNGSEAPYVLAVGTRESFGPGDIVRFPIWWRNAREHAGLPVWYGLVIFGLIVVGIAYLLIRIVVRISR